MASPKTLAIRFYKTSPKTISMGPLAYVHYFGATESITPVSIRRSEWRRYCKNSQISAVIPVHIENPFSGIRAFDQRPQVKS
jgi:hypothetical protein